MRQGWGSSELSKHSRFIWCIGSIFVAKMDVDIARNDSCYPPVTDALFHLKDRYCPHQTRHRDFEAWERWNLAVLVLFSGLSLYVSWSALSRTLTCSTRNLWKRSLWSKPAGNQCQSGRILFSSHIKICGMQIAAAETLIVYATAPF